MQLSREKSEQQAALIMQVGFIASAMDVDYLRECSRQMRQQAYRQETLAVLNPRHPQSKNDLLFAQSAALRTLCDYIDALKKVDEVKKAVASDKQYAEDISKLFL